MKCQFCQQPCFLLPEEDPDFLISVLNWECKRHPVKVIHHIYRRFYSTRRNREIRGEIRRWKNTLLTWKVGKLYWRANFWRNEIGEPTSFTVDTIAEINPGRRDIRYNAATNKYGIIKLKGHPKEITPENVITKIKTYIVFS